jgi:hypothetical protein
MHSRFGITQTDAISPRHIPAGYRERIECFDFCVFYVR